MFLLQSSGLAQRQGFVPFVQQQNAPMRSMDKLPRAGKNSYVKPTTHFPKSVVRVLRDWLEKNRANPFPTDDEKARLLQ